MTFTYRILAPGLHDTASAAVDWFISDWGVKKRSIEVEEPFHADVDFRPTFVSKLDDGHLLCIEVSENIYSNTLDTVVLSCQQLHLPVKLVVAVPKGTRDPDYGTKLKKAKSNGVGILEVDSNSGALIRSPLSLSLVNVRPIKPTEFPARFRQPLQQATEVFRDGEPVKACSLIYDELESVTRLVAEKCAAKGLWTPNRLKIDTSPWATVMKAFDDGLNRKKDPAKRLNPALLARVRGVIPHRNESGHKPKNLKERIARDQQLRTRFEGGADLLHDFIEAAKPFRI